MFNSGFDLSSQNHADCIRKHSRLFLALLTIVSKSFSDWGGELHLSVRPSRLSYLKNYVYEFGVNHTNDAL